MVFRNDKHGVLFEKEIRYHKGCRRWLRQVAKVQKQECFCIFYFLRIGCGPFWSIRATPVTLTADPRLWRQAENHIGTNEIDIEAMKPRRLDAMSYVCFAVAKDIITGSKIVALTELGDASMLPPRYFLVIQTAMLIRVYGLSAANRLSFTEGRDQNELRQK